MVRKGARWLICAMWFLTSAFTNAQQGTELPVDYSTDRCAQFSDGLAHADAFSAFCNWVVSFDTKLPNIIGDQETHRFQTENGKDHRLVDTTSARIAYIEGRPRFSDVAINHVKVHQSDDLPDAAQLHGAWSYGDYGTDLHLLFASHIVTHFSFLQAGDFHGTPVVVFGYEVRESDNERWELRAREKIGSPMLSAFPGFHGKIFLDARNFDLIRFERETTTIEKHFPLRYGSNLVDYRRLPLGDGTTFVLPVESVVTFCHDSKHHHCDVNDTRFANWQKFGAKSRILTGADNP